MKITPLSREEVVKAVERKNPARIPMVRCKWWGEGLDEQYGDRLAEFAKYPEDVAWAFMPNPVDPWKMKLSWKWDGAGGHDSRVVIDDWAKLDEFIAAMPKAKDDPEFSKRIAEAREAGKQGRYVMFGWWTLFFEKPWALRGMENLLVDFYMEQDNMHRLYKALCDTYCDYIERAVRELKPDGFWSSDDLGHQTGPMMGPDIFHEHIYPYYKRLGGFLEKRKIHFWLHSCGDNTLLLPDLIESGLTVFHPVQKHTMNEKKVAAEFGDRLTFLAGMDVQHTLQEADPAGVRKEVRFLIDTFDRPAGGMCIAAGNGIVSGTPFENIDAFLDEAVKYGTEHRRKAAK